jgi:hypothetical protein
MMDEKKSKELAKKKQDKKVMTWLAVITGILAAILLIVGIVLDVNNSTFADGVLAFFALMLLFCIMSVVIVFGLKRAIKYLEHPELKVIKEKQSNTTTRSKTGYRMNPYNDELEEDDGLSIEEIDFFESDIFDE